MSSRTAVWYKLTRALNMNLLDLLQDADPRSPAICAPGRSALSHGALRQLVARVGDRLRACGFGETDPVAVVLPNGPELASAFLAVASIAPAAPLNPALLQHDFELLLADLGARALITIPGFAKQAELAANVLGVPVVEIRASEVVAGEFTLGVGRTLTEQIGKRFETRDVALLLHTSGTTSRPKLVPLTHSNLSASVRSTIRTLQLSPEDRCLNVMPLFHIHGLSASLLASLASGGSVWCVPGLNAMGFMRMLGESAATWYTAVPSMHQAIVERAMREDERRPRLRFVRSCSAPLAETVWKSIESVFDAPVVSAYGMTEASHQITSTELPPYGHGRGTVGLPGATRVAIVNDMGARLPAGHAGEVVIEGPAVTKGYVDNAAANDSAFTDGWFHTGDVGTFDGVGNLTLCGRIKEIINCAGEKISPFEVDEVLLSHPAVRQAVAFALPDSRHGEVVAAAVVPRAGCEVTPEILLGFAREHLPRFKTPRRIVLVDSIPLGPTGKVQRIGLASRLKLE